MIHFNEMSHLINIPGEVGMGCFQDTFLCLTHTFMDTHESINLSLSLWFFKTGFLYETVLAVLELTL